MANLSEKYKKLGKIVIADFVCPLPETRKLFNPDYFNLGGPPNQKRKI